MDDELHQLTENLFEVCVCVLGGGGGGGVAVNCEGRSRFENKGNFAF